MPISVDTQPNLDSLLPAWATLVERSGAPPWMRLGWVRAWLAAHSGGAPQVVAARSDERLEGIAVFRPSDASREIPVWHGLIATTDEVARQLAQAICARGGRHLAFHFGFRGMCGLEAVKSAAESAHYRLVTVPYLRSPYVRTDGSWERYLATRRSRFVKQIERSCRQLRERGTLGFEVCDGREQLDDLLREGLEIEGSGWKDRLGTAIRSSPTSLRYYTALAQWAAEEGILRLAFLRLNGRPIAFELLIDDGQSIYDLKGGYLEEHAKFGPGMIMARECIGHAFQQGRRTFELLGDAEPWKLSWADDVHDRTTVRAFAPSIAGRLDYVTFTIARPLARKARTLTRQLRSRFDAEPQVARSA